jgi:hypothetical protein
VEGSKIATSIMQRAACQLGFNSLYLPKNSGGSILLYILLSLALRQMFTKAISTDDLGGPFDIYEHADSTKRRGYGACRFSAVLTRLTIDAVRSLPTNSICAIARSII